MSRVLELQDAVRLIDAVRMEIEQGIATLSLDDQIILGQRLWAARKRAEEALDPIKDNLRAEAVKQTGGKPGAAHLDATDGSRCTVSIPQPSLQVKKDADMAGLKTLLGGAFNDLFEEVVTYKPRKDLQTTAPTLPPDQTKAVLGAVERVEPTPKVFFKE